MTGAFALLKERVPEANGAELLKRLRDTGKPISYRNIGKTLTTPGSTSRGLSDSRPPPRAPSRVPPSRLPRRPRRLPPRRTRSRATAPASTRSRSRTCASAARAARR
nr:hypothetical protein GCM10020093_057420 [Planobispora longispora]